MFQSVTKTRRRIVGFGVVKIQHISRILCGIFTILDSPSLALGAENGRGLPRITVTVSTNEGMDLLPREIDWYYRLGLESQGLSSAVGDLERQRTEAIIARSLRPPPAEIFDVGGAAGVYAFPLAELGYAVHLIDPVQLHLEQARESQLRTGVRLASIRLGEARKLEAADQTADALLLLGPLYHLTERTERIAALREAHRVLKPAGTLFAAAISRFASLISGLSEGFFTDAAFRDIIDADLRSGQHRNPRATPKHFTTAYFHRPDELAEEIREASFEPPRVLGVEGPVWSASHFAEAWADPAQRERLLDFLSQVEEEPSIQGASAHLLAVTRRPPTG